MAMVRGARDSLPDEARGDRLCREAASPCPRPTCRVAQPANRDRDAAPLAFDPRRAFGAPHRDDRLAFQAALLRLRIWRIW